MIPSPLTLLCLHGLILVKFSNGPATKVLRWETSKRMGETIRASLVCSRSKRSRFLIVHVADTFFCSFFIMKKINTVWHSYFPLILSAGTITVGGMRMNPCRQGHPTSTIGALPSLSSSFFADRDIGHGGERNRDPLSCRFARLRSPCRKTPPQVARESAGTLCMRSRGM